MYWKEVNCARVREQMEVTVKEADEGMVTRKEEVIKPAIEELQYIK